MNWSEDDNLVVAWLILTVNPDCLTDPVSEDHKEFVRVSNALGVNATQLTARVNTFRSNIPGYKGLRTGNPMNSSASVRRIVDEMVGSPTSVKIFGSGIVKLRLGETDPG